MVFCIPKAQGVPGPQWGQPPTWLDGLPDPKSTKIDDPRWRGATARGYGAGAYEEATFRALYQESGSARSVLLSWHVKYDALLNAGGGSVDRVIICLQPGGSGDALVIDAQPYATSSVTFEDQNASGISVYKLTGGGAPDASGRAQGTLLTPQPAWVNTNLKAWLISTSMPAGAWAIQLRIPLKAGALIADAGGLDLTNTFKMAFEMYVVTPTRRDGNTTVGTGGIIAHKWPLTIPDADYVESFPNPSYPTADSYETFRLETPGDALCSSKGMVSLDPSHIGVLAAGNALTNQIRYKQPVPPLGTAYNNTEVNTFVARIKNETLAADAVTPETIPAGAITANFRMANFGAVLDQMWTPIPNGSAVTNGTAGNPAGNIPPGLDTGNHLSFNHTVSQADALLYEQWIASNGASGRSPHQCVLVTLSGSNITFRNDSAYQNMTFVRASTFRREVTLAGAREAPQVDAPEPVGIPRPLRPFPIEPGTIDPSQPRPPIVRPVVQRDTVFISIETRNMPARVPPGSIRKAVLDRLETKFVLGRIERALELVLKGEAGVDLLQRVAGEFNAPLPRFSTAAKARPGTLHWPTLVKALRDVAGQPQVLRRLPEAKAFRDSFAALNERAWKKMRDTVVLLAKRGQIPSLEIETFMPTWRAHIYRDTGRRIHMGKVEYAILSPEPSFGFYVEHDGPVEGWEHGLTGAGLTREASRFYSAKVPRGGALKLTTTIRTRDAQ